MAEPDLGLLGGGAPTMDPVPVAATPAPASDVRGGDPAVWTLLGEAGTDPKDQFGVASTIYNRQQHFGKTAQEIVTDPGQAYEAWQDARARAATQARYPVGSAAYNAAAAVLDSIESGKEPPASYTHFFGPKSQAALGRQPPQWSAGQQGTDIGGNRFYTLPGQLGGAGEPDLTKIGTVNGQVPTAIYDAKAPGAHPGQAVPDPQALAVAFLAKNGFRNEDAPVGSSTNPAGQVAGQGPPSEKGSWYVTPDGKLRQTGDPTPDYLPRYAQLASLRAAYMAQPFAQRTFGLEGIGTPGAPGGAVQGGIDLLHSLNRFEAGPLGIVNPLAQQEALASEPGYQAERNNFNLLRGGDPLAQASRFGAQDVGVTAAGAGLGGALGAAGPVGEFLAGESGGVLALPSSAASGALQGGLAAGLTSGTNDEALGPQLLNGAEFGGGLGFGGRALRSGGNMLLSAPRDFLAPFSASGREGMVNRNLLAMTGGPISGDFTEYVPGSRPTLAQATQNPNLATAERTLRSSNPLATAAFDQKANASAAAREAYVDNLTGAPSDLQGLIAQREAQTAPLREAAFARKAPTNSQGVVDQIDGLLGTPEGQEPQARQALEALRGKLVSSEEGLTPEQSDALTRGVTAAMGQESPTIDRAYMAARKAAIGSEFDRVAGATTIQNADALLSNLGQVAHAASQELTDPQLKPLLNQISEIGSVVQPGGTISGQSYQALTRRGGPLDRIASSNDPSVAHYGGQLRDALDDALESSAAPEDRAALQTARAQWRNMKIAEDAMRSAAPGAALDPRALYSAVRRSTPDIAYRSGGPVGDLAEQALGQAAARDVYETDPVKLYGARQALAQIADRGGAVGNTLSPMVNELDSVIDRGAPGYAHYRAQYDAASRPIDAMTTLQGLNLTDMRGNVTLGRVNTAIQGLERQRAQPGANPAKSLTDDQMNALYNLRSDLQRADLTVPLGRSGRAPIVTGNLDNEGVVNALTSPVGTAVLGAVTHHPMGAVAVNVAKAISRSKQGEVGNLLVQRMLNPDETAAPFSAPGAAAPRNPLMATGKFLGKSLIPAAVLARRQLASP